MGRVNGRCLDAQSKALLADEDELEGIAAEMDMPGADVVEDIAAEMDMLVADASCPRETGRGGDTLYLGGD